MEDRNIEFWADPKNRTISYYADPSIRRRSHDVFMFSVPAKNHKNLVDGQVSFGMDMDIFMSKLKESQIKMEYFAMIIRDWGKHLVPVHYNIFETIKS
jgi:hypothetical protein